MDTPCGRWSTLPRMPVPGAHQIQRSRVLIFRTVGRDRREQVTQQSSERDEVQTAVATLRDTSTVLDTTRVRPTFPCGRKTVQGGEGVTPAHLWTVLGVNSTRQGLTSPPGRRLVRALYGRDFPCAGECLPQPPGTARHGRLRRRRGQGTDSRGPPPTRLGPTPGASVAGEDLRPHRRGAARAQRARIARTGSTHSGVAAYDRRRSDHAAGGADKSRGRAPRRGAVRGGRGLGPRRPRPAPGAGSRPWPSPRPCTGCTVGGRPRRALARRWRSASGSFIPPIHAQAKRGNCWPASPPGTNRRRPRTRARTLLRAFPKRRPTTTHAR